MNSSLWFRLGCLLAATAVALGAWAAHGLDQFCLKKYPLHQLTTIAGMETTLAWKRVQDFKTGVDYQVVHAVALVVIGAIGGGRCRATFAAGSLFLVGIVCFSGSLYAITLTGNTKFGIIAPIGGTAFILGWVVLMFAVRPKPLTVDS